MASTYLYDLDLSGTQPGNKVLNEKHIIVKPTQITQASFIVMRACPFYGDSVVVKDGKTATARTLIKGQDYILTHQSIALSKLTKLKVYASITFVDRNYTGEVYVTYQTVGGEYVPNDYTIVEKLTREKYQLRKTSFDQIVGLPSSYPNPPHQHNPTDMVGLSEVVTGLKDVAVAIRGVQGSYGTLDTIIKAHLTSTASHTPSQVGLGLVRNYDVALIGDFDTRATDKYVTPITIADWTNQKLTTLKNFVINGYLTKADTASLYLDKQTAYTKAEVNNLFFDKAYLNTNFLKKTEALTEAQVGAIVNQIVDLSQYHTRTEAYSLFYTKDQADTRYYTKTQADSKFLTVTQADGRYIQTTNAESIISPVTDNTVTLRDGKFYTGKLAPAAVTNLYIDCINGSDNNPGTRAAPIQTLERANEMTPNNRSSTWWLRHYTVDQMKKAAMSYQWDFNTSIEAGAVRTISVYGHTWIDGAKAAVTKQTGNGSFDWRFVNEVERLPIYLTISLDETRKTQKLFGLTLMESARILLNGIALIKPSSFSAQYAATDWLNTSFFRGEGEIGLYGCYMLTMGAFTDNASHAFSWTASNIFEDLNIAYVGSAFGYTRETNVNGMTVFDNDFNSLFGYSGKNYPFKYSNARGSIFAIDGYKPTAAAVTNGATPIINNMKTVLQRPYMFSGLNFVNGVCTNLLTNLVISPN